MADLLRRPVRIATSAGDFHAEFSPRGVVSLQFPAAKSRPVTPAIRSPLARRLAKELKTYLAGRTVRWTVPVDLTAGTGFQRQVWQALRTIAHGETRSYAWVAQKIGRPRATRAVGAACGANPVPILVPCHRVVASDGSLGGFSGGLKWKKQLLNLEKPPATQHRK